jgi:hypothetical protein
VGPNKYAATDNKYTANANTVTIKRLGPSESLKKMKSALLQTMAVATNINKEIFFDLKYRFVI